MNQNNKVQKTLAGELDGVVNGGFTIIELLIATLVFSVIMLLLSYSVLQIARVYYKGITEANTQTVARRVINEIAQAYQFNANSSSPTPLPAPGPGGSTSLCVGNIQFSYVLGYQLVSGAPKPLPNFHQTNYSLVESSSGCNGGLNLLNIASLPSGSKELMGKNMRLSQLSVSQVAGNTRQYQIDVRVVYGDEDLLDDPAGTNASCRGSTGSQFCATAELSTIVTERNQ